MEDCLFGHEIYTLIDGFGLHLGIDYVDNSYISQLEHTKIS